MIFNLNNPYDVQKFDDYVAKMRRQCAVVELKKRHPQRSLAQNSYLHVILSYFACVYGCSMEYVKSEYFKKVCNPDLLLTKRTTKIGEVITDTRSTSELDTAQMTLAIERFRNWSASVAGIYLPSPSEGEAMVYIEQMVEQHKEYLYGEEVC